MDRRFALLLVLVVCLGLLWTATPARTSPQEGQAAPATGDSLGGSDRYLTYLSTDKPIYRPGETLYLRGVPLHYLTRKPLATPNQAIIEVKGPKGDTVASGFAPLEESVYGFSWKIPAEQAGGEYTIKFSDPSTGQPPAERKFDVRAYRAPRLKSQIKFLRDGYGAGDEVIATLHAERAEGGVPAGSKVTVIARVDGQEVFRGPTVIDSSGNCQARFKLPAEISRGEGTLALLIEDGGVLETASKTIPILLQTVDLTLYPEGGELVAGLANRVYVEAFTPTKKPADLAGVVVDAGGKEVAQFRSEHEGRGRFTFTPAAGGKYTLKITEPSGIKTTYPLPEVKPAGVVLSAASDVTAKGDDVKLTLAATAAGTYRVTLSQREFEAGRRNVELTAGGSKEISLSPGTADGVLRATVWSADGKPLAERLIFRQPDRVVQVELSADAKQYVPGTKAKIKVKTTDELGQPIHAVVGITATDDSVLEMIDKREQAPRLPVMVLLEADVKELADAQVYLDPKHEKSSVAVDLLLGTQGWRRFAFVNPTKFVEANGERGRRVLAMKQPIRQIFERDAQRFFMADDAAGAAEAAPQWPPPHRWAAAAVPAKADAPPAAPPVANEPVDKAEREELAAQGPPPPAQPPREIAGEEAQDRRQQGAQAGDGQGGMGQAGFAADAMFEGGERGIVAGKRMAGGRGGMGWPVRNDFIPVRVFAHEVRSGRKPGERTDFSETLFWTAGVRTGADGTAQIDFDLSDAVTSFRVFGDAFSEQGALGAASLVIDSVEPFYLEPKLPLEVTTGDRIRLPLGIVNATNSPLSNASLRYQVAMGAQEDTNSLPLNLPANGRVRQVLDLPIGSHVGDVRVTLDATAGGFADKVTRTFKVGPLGFPTPVGFGGLLAAGGHATHEVIVPETLVPGSLETRVVVYPTPLASMNEALAALIQQPSGCFEQSSSTIYPLIMAQQYFMSHQGVDPSLIDRSARILETGYDKLRGFESPGRGYEWFGADPGHDALTAYGLLEFSDMARVRNVDPAMLERTRDWLLAQRDGQGGYSRKTHTLHTWIADPECANAYNTWALLETGTKADLAKEVSWVRDNAMKSQNTYAVALSANVLILAGDKDGANKLLDKLAGKQQDNGSLAGATTSVIGSGGDALSIETTALAVLAWLQNPSYAANVEKSIQYLAESCKSGRFGSTQSTVLALRAIVAYDNSRAQPKAPGSLQLMVDGRPVGQPVAFDQQTSGGIDLPPFAELLTPGKHELRVAMRDGSAMPYSMSVNYNSTKPNSSEQCKVHLEVSLRDKKIDEGSATEAKVVMVNRTAEIIPTPIAIIGIPGGLEVRHDQLKELVKSGKIAAYEVTGRNVVLYWRSLEKEARIELDISLIGAVPGTYTGPASRAYLYYTDEHKHWAEGLKVEIEPKKS